MRIILYTLLFAQTAAIIYLTSIMPERPFNSSDMRNANYFGCQIGRFWIKSDKFTCSGSADNFKSELDRLDAIDDENNK
jgi:hypothetical protein